MMLNSNQERPYFDGSHSWGGVVVVGSESGRLLLGVAFPRRGIQRALPLSTTI